MSGKKIIDGLNEVIAAVRSGKGKKTLVEELRESCGGLCEHERYGCLRCKAAAEIERLNQEIKQYDRGLENYRKEAERLKAANEALEIMEATGRREATGFIAEIERLRAALRSFIGASVTNEQRMRAAIVEARHRLAKGRSLWNGPCVECDAVLEQALTVNNDPADIARAALKEENDEMPMRRWDPPLKEEGK